MLGSVFDFRMSTLNTVQLHMETFPEGVQLRCRYLRVEQAVEYCPFKKSKLYDLLRRGDIKSFLLKQPGCTHGIRLIDRDSVDAYLERMCAAAELQQLAQEEKAA